MPEIDEQMGIKRNQWLLMLLEREWYVCSNEKVPGLSKSYACSELFNNNNRLF
jgi:hypothetical protein